MTSGRAIGRPPGVTDGERAAIVREYAGGRPIAGIAERWGVSERWVRVLGARAGLPPRPRGRRLDADGRAAIRERIAAGDSNRRAAAATGWSEATVRRVRAAGREDGAR